MMKGISKTFIAGLVTMAPIVATFYFLYWLFGSAEALLGRLIRLVIPDHFYRPGMGLAAGVVLIFFIGLLMHAWIVQSLFDWGERLLYKVPIIKTVYGSIRDFLHFFSRPGKGGDEFRQVVMVPLGETGMEAMGFVTRKDFSDLPKGIGTEETVAVYMPLSYQIGGHTLMVPRSALRGVDMSIEKAMRFILTGAMTTSPSMARDNRKKP
ncbi:MAG: DUF502 domain-containing protein [Desulfobacterales bacterium]|nr:DUF502 domain-containing protein [Desulfobacterales bacterium]